MRKSSAVLFLIVSLTVSVNTQAEEASDWYQAGQQALKDARNVIPNTRRAKNIILFVGDGMGVSTVTAARILQGQARGENGSGDGEGNLLAFERLPYVAMSKTYSANQQTPDSAPTMTAMVTGVKTNDGVLSVNQAVESGDADNRNVQRNRLTTILELAEQHGLATGVVTTTRITHATPAATYAHTSMRDWEADSNVPSGSDVKDIAAQLIDNFDGGKAGSGPEVVLGGGRTKFLPLGISDPEYPEKHGERKDGRNLVEEFSQKFNASYVWNRQQFDAIDPLKTHRLIGLFEPSHMQYEHDRARDKSGEPSLAEMTSKAIDILKNNRKGYFLMVEGGRIDHAHHAGNAFRALTDTIAFSDAVQAALGKVDLNDTLVIVTADHSHTFTISGYPQRGNPILGKVVIAGKPGYALADDGKPYTTLSYANGKGNHTGLSNDEVALQPARPGRDNDVTDVDTEDPDYHQHALVPLAAETHAAEDVEIFAGGPHAYLFHGVQQQNYIFHVMKDAFGF